MKERETDFQRWKNLDRAWPERSDMIAEMIPKESNVVDLGSGTQDLKRALSNSCKYQAVDLYPRDENTIVCDFNKGQFPNIRKFDVVVCQGLLEYIADINNFIKKMKGEKINIICTYHIKTEKSIKAEEWFHQYDIDTFSSFFTNNGFILDSCRKIFASENQFIFSWVPAGK